MFQKQNMNDRGKAPSPNWNEMIRAGAQIVDVRTKEEYASGHLSGTLNIPLSDLLWNLGKLSKDRPVIVCCASGVRSDSAQHALQEKGYEVYNGGSWISLEEAIR